LAGSQFPVCRLQFVVTIHPYGKDRGDKLKI
jgi:hypothetical protein